MRSLKILILEDEIITATDLKVTLGEAGHTVTDIARNQREAMASVKNNPPDIAILDIFLQNSGADGISVASELLEHRWMPVIYLTANSDPQTFHRAKETLPAAYLLKPFRHEELAYQVELAYYYFSQTEPRPGTTGYRPEYLFVREKEVYRKIRKKEILYLRANRAYSVMYLVDKVLTVTGNLSYLSQYLPESNFFRLSRSFIVNLDQVERFDQNFLYFPGEEKEGIPIPSGSRKELLRALNVLKTTG